jgi:hypothetical protein
MEHCLAEADQTERDSVSYLFIYMCDRIYIYIYVCVCVCVYGAIAVGLKCRPYLETSYAIIFFAFTVNML